MGYDIFEELCRINDTNASQVSKATGVATATISSWKKGVYKPKRDKLEKFAAYFGVSVDLFEKEKPANNDAEFLADMVFDRELVTYIKKVSDLDKDKRKQIFDYIDYICAK